VAFYRDFAGILGVLLSLFFITQAGRLGYDDKVESITSLATRISALFPNLAFWKPLANTVATYLESIFFIGVGLLLSIRNKGLRLFFLASTVIIGVALIFTSSRGAWLAVIAASLLWAAIYWKPVRLLTVLGTVGLVALILYVVIHRDINAIRQIPALNGVLVPLFIRPDRLEVYKNSLMLIAECPILRDWTRQSVCPGFTPVTHFSSKCHSSFIPIICFLKSGWNKDYLGLPYGSGYVWLFLPMPGDIEGLA